MLTLRLISVCLVAFLSPNHVDPADGGGSDDAPPEKVYKATKYGLTMTAAFSKLGDLDVVRVTFHFEKGRAVWLIRSIEYLDVSYWDNQKKLIKTEKALVFMRGLEDGKITRGLVILNAAQSARWISVDFGGSGLGIPMMPVEER